MVIFWPRAGNTECRGKIVKTFRIMIALGAVFSIALMMSCSMHNLPKGDFVSAYNSPQNTYTLNIYLCGGHATVDFSIRGELVNNKDGSISNIYWNYHEQEADVEWIDDSTVIINGRELDVRQDIYDYRKE